jgi:trigger factor
MQVSVEATTGLERRMKVTVPSVTVESQIDERLKKAASTARLDGFRVGKVPMREIKRRFGVGIRQEVTGELVQSTYFEAVQQESLNPAGMPNIEDMVSESGKDLEFVAVFEVFPEIVPADFSKIGVEKLIAEVTDDDVDNTIEKLREQQLEYSEVKRKAKLDDKLNLDFEGSIDGEAFEGGTSEGFDLVLGSGSMIPGFEDGLKGVKAGEEKTLQVTFPEEYHAKDIAGKAAEFKVKVHTVSKPELPELNEELFARYGVKEGGLEAFKAEIRKNMERELASAVKTRLKNNVMEGLLAANPVELPKALIDTEIDRLRQEAVQQFGGENASKIDPSILPAEMFTTQAEKRVSLGLLMSEVLKQSELEVDKDRVRTTIEEMASSYEDSDQVIEWYYSNEQQLSQVENMVLEDQVVDHLLDKVQVTEVKSSYEDAIKQPAPEQLEDSEAGDEVEAEAPDPVGEDQNKD